MARAAVVLVNHHLEVALIERRQDGRIYYVFPGGTIEAGESAEQAAIREAWEELGVQVAVGSLVAEVARLGARQYFYRATIVGGEFGSGRPGSRPEHEAGGYRAVWLPLDDLPAWDVRPRMLGAALSTIPTKGWPADVLTIADDG